MPVSVDARKTLISGVVVTTWANRPTTGDSGQFYLFTDIGASGTLMRYAGSRWRPLAGQAQLASLGAAVTGIANSETIVLQTLIPAGAWQQYDTIRLWVTYTKSGTTDTANLTVRVGAAGTTADTPITGLSGFTVIGVSGVSGAAIFDVKLLTATSAQKIGSQQAQTGSYTSSSVATGAVSATTITDTTTNALYVSVGLLSGGATNTVSVQSAQIQLITP